ncbi:MAG: efflux RND transporter periplasmic adaptor subunit [Bacteroidota bacterium]
MKAPSRSLRFRSPLFAVILLSMVFLAACGGGGDDKDVGKKKDELTKLKTEYKELGKKIRSLEKEIEELDPTTKKDPRVPVKVMAVKEKTFQHFVKVQGQVQSDQNIQVRPQASGTVSKVYVEEGQTVKKGQLLAKIDDAILRKSIDELKTQLTLADTVYRRQQRLWKQDIGSEIQLLQAKTQKESLEKRIITTSEQLTWSNVTAPISGIVDMVYTKKGEAASPMAPAFQIVNLSKLEFKADLSEAYIPYIKRGDEVSIRFPAIDQRVNAKVRNVSQTVHPMNRTVAVYVDLPGKGTELRANMVGEISINDVTHENVVTLPQEYVQKGAEGSYVTVAKKGESGEYEAQRVTIKAGLSYSGEVEVLQGLKPNELLVIEGYQGLNNGQQIRFEGVTNK